MERNLEIRRPIAQKHHGLSTVSKIFFGVDIFQVVMVVTFQGVMIAYGNFNAFNSPENPGMGPGRRVYMCVFMGVVVYTCFLCLFAVKQQNILEIIAFLLQNFGFVTYGLIQVYHVGYKKQPIPGSNTTIQHSSILRNVALTNSLALFLLNGVFIFLSWKLYSEFGWKIYKRVKFNISLRSIYHFYQLLSCLLKMEIMYWWMYAICNSFVLLRDTGTPMYYVNLGFIPLSVIYAGLGYIATQREIKILMSLFIVWTIGGSGYFVYKLYGFTSDTCNGCQEFYDTGKDIHDEAILHFVYLGSLNLILLLAILGVASKVFYNFGKGLEEHFKPEREQRPRAATNLYLRRVSNYPEESVVSVTSYESEYDELNASMRLDYHQMMSTSAVPLMESEDHALASSMPNLAETNKRKATTLPLKNGNSYLESALRTFDKPKSSNSKLAAIDEDQDLTKNGNGFHKPGDINETKSKEPRLKEKLENKWDEVNGRSKESEDKINETKVFQRNVHNDEISDGLRVAERDSGCVDCHGYKEVTNCGLKPILTRKTGLTSDNRNFKSLTAENGLSKSKITDGRVDRESVKHISMSRSNNVKCQINLFNTRE